MKEGIWLQDTQGGEVFVYFDTLADDPTLLQQIVKPIGGFCYSADYFAHLDLPETPFYIKGWLPIQGKMLLYAPAKSGKSYLGLQMARCLGSGEDFLGLPVRKAKTLYLQFELGHPVLQGRLRETGKDYENVFVGTSFDLKVDTIYGGEKLYRALAEVQPEVLIVDPFYKLLRGDENASQDVIRITDCFDSLIETHKVSIVIIHHSGKDLSQGSRGSSVLEGYPDSCIELRKLPDKDKFRIKLTPKLLRHAELPPKPIEAVWDKGEFCLLTEGKTTVDQIIEIAQRDGKFEPAQWIDKIASRRTVYLAVRSAIAQGRLVRRERGVYQPSGGQT